MTDRVWRDVHRDEPAGHAGWSNWLRIDVPDEAVEWQARELFLLGKSSFMVKETAVLASLRWEDLPDYLRDNFRRQARDYLRLVVEHLRVEMCDSVKLVEAMDGLFAREWEPIPESREAY